MAGFEAPGDNGLVVRLLNLFADLRHRQSPLMYWLIRRLKLQEAAAIIIEDIPLLNSQASEGLNMPVYEMFETLAFLDDAAGHRALITLLPDSPPHFRYAILDFLSQYRPELARPQLMRYRLDPELRVRELCDRLLDSTPERSAPDPEG